MRPCVVKDEVGKLKITGAGMNKRSKTSIVIRNTQCLASKMMLWGEVSLGPQQPAIFRILQGLANASLYPGGVPLKSNGMSHV